MKSYETKKCNNDLLCGEDLVCGSSLTLQDDMQEFVYYNVGHINSGWIQTDTTPGEYEYLYVNVENVTSSTLDIIRIKNNIIADIPNIYGTKLTFNATTGQISLIGRNDEDVLSTIQLLGGLALVSIESNSEDHTITFTFNNHEDIVIDIYNVLQMYNYYTKEEIDNMYKLETSVSDEPIANIQLVNNIEISYTDLHEGTFTVSEDFKHGDVSSITFTSTISPIISFPTPLNNLPNKFIKDNNVYEQSELTFEADLQYNILILCNGLANEIYIQEINQ